MCGCSACRDITWAASLFARCSICLPVLLPIGQITAAARGPGRARRLLRTGAPWVCQSRSTANGGTSGRTSGLCKFALECRRAHSSAGIAVNGVAMAFQYGNLVCEFLGARSGAVANSVSLRRNLLNITCSSLAPTTADSPTCLISPCVDHDNPVSRRCRPRAARGRL